VIKRAAFYLIHRDMKSVEKVRVKKIPASWVDEFGTGSCSDRVGAAM